MKFDAGASGVRFWALIAVSVAMQVHLVGGQSLPGEAKLEGALLDPSGHYIAGAKLTLVNSATGVSRTTVSSSSGLYELPDLDAGTYRLKVNFPGFAPYQRDIALESTGLQKLDVVLQLASRKESVTVSTASVAVYSPLAGTERKLGAGETIGIPNIAETLNHLAGVSLRDNGELATIPMLHGLGDERVKTVVNGMTVSPSCPNHMNPPLSYIDPSSVAKLGVTAGITPVSMGGDSIGGTISVDSPSPVFAGPGERVHSEGAFSTFVRSNGPSYGAALWGSVATQHLGLGYSGSWTNSDDYRDGRGHLVTSTYAQNTAHAVTLAAHDAGNLFVLQAGLQNTPYQGFPNQQMDMTANHSEFVNLHYRGDHHWGAIDTRVFWQNVRHEMNVGRDKSTFPNPMWMPMDTHGRDVGYSVKLGMPLSERHNLQLGSEFQRFALDDTWPAVPGKAPMMGPNSFLNINNGHRLRLGWFAEMYSRWNSSWSTLFGIRNDTVWMNTGPVSGYSAMYATDAGAFNALRRARTDIDMDLTTLARYEPTPHSTFEFGYARKTRAPSLYERYAWSTNWMASEMINWFGDANSYVGNVNLKPEVAHTVSGTASWHDRARKEWEVRITPFQSYIADYIDVDQIATRTRGESTFSQLRFANHDSRILGIDLDGHVTTWCRARYGQGEISGVAGWLRGKRLDTGNGLYQIMPLHARIGFDEKLRSWTAGPEIQLVGRKSDVDPLRFEPRTPGYALLNLHSGYAWTYLRIDAGGINLLNKYYYLPLGGVNLDDFQASGRSGQIGPLSGPGRSFYVGLTIPL